MPWFPNDAPNTLRSHIRHHRHGNCQIVNAVSIHVARGNKE